MKRLIFLSTLLVTVSGCMSTEELRKQDAAKCSGYGFRAGTPQFAQCMMQADRQRERSSDCLSAALGAYSGAPQGEANAAYARANADCMAGRPVRAPAQAAPTPNMMPRNTTCTKNGNTYNCTTN